MQSQMLNEKAPHCKMSRNKQGLWFIEAPQRKQRQPQPSGSNDRSNSPRPMEVQDREPSPIRNVLQHDLSHVNATPGSQQTGTAYNEQTLLDNTVLGGLPISVEDGPGSPV